MMGKSTNTASASTAEVVVCLLSGSSKRLAAQPRSLSPRKRGAETPLQVTDLQLGKVTRRKHPQAPQSKLDMADSSVRSRFECPEVQRQGSRAVERGPGSFAKSHGAGREASQGDSPRERIGDFQRLVLQTYGHGSNSRTISEHPNPH